ncbi:metallophosphatase domain-containing protein [Methylobacter sp.]|uniref:metallophosphatase domain-containing protein n=1 Tax=Methylobacter sp. TaxID=2051955 RepID=UPI002FDCF77B
MTICEENESLTIEESRVQARKETSVQVLSNATMQLTSKPSQGMRIVCLSDTHFPPQALQVPEGDVLIVAGDVCLRGHDYELELFDRFLGRLPHRHKLLVAGNHDWVLADAGREAAKLLVKNAIYLEDSGVEIEGVKFWGSPWQPEFMNWAFNLPRGPQLANVWAKIPNDIDVLITHSPPCGILDQIPSGEHVGCDDLLAALQRVRPKVHVFGHIHEGYGVLKHSGTTFINASICDDRYRPVNAPIVIDL